MGELLSVSQSAAFLGVSEEDVRELHRGGQLVAVQAKADAEIQFERTEIERYASRPGSAGSTFSTPHVRSIEPQFVTANDLQGWSGRIAQDTAPELIRRLLRATQGVSGITMRAGDGVALGGWDGLATNNGEGGSFLPVGRLGIEIGTSKDVAGKARDDFKNRLSIPTMQRADVHFVFVTTRRWRDKSAWTSEKAALGEFASVSVLDADDLEGWLQSERSVHIWLSELFGRQPRDVQSLVRWWREFSRTTKPSLPAALFDVRPPFPTELVRGFFAGEPGEGVLTLRGTWKTQVLGTISRIVTMCDESITPVVVHTASAWSRMLDNDSPVLLIPLFDEPDVGGALAAGHRVALIAGADTQLRPGTPVVDVVPLGRFDASRVLEESGVGSLRADRLAALFRRSPKAFVRSISLDPRVRSARPGATAEESRVAARLALAVQWSASKADRQFLEDLTGSSWGELERFLLAQESSEDPMFVRSGESWRVAAPVESSALQYPRLAADDIKIWMGAAKDVLLAPHPFDSLNASQRLIAELKGQERPRSTTLVDGFMRGLVLMSLVEEEVAGRRGDEIAAAVVRSILIDEEGLLDLAVWRQIASSLPLLAEAAPEVFIDAVLDDLSSTSSSISTFFGGAEERENDLFSPWQPYVHLLWALEVLASSNEYFEGAMRTLAELSASTAPESKSGSAVFDSLVNYLYPWLSYSDAGTKGQQVVIDRMIRHQPQLAWRVLSKVVNLNNFFSTQPARARFRDWAREETLVADEVWAPVFEGLVARSVECAGTDLRRWAELIPALDRLNSESFDRALSGLEEAVQSANSDSEGGRTLWRALDDEVCRHREHSEQPWSLSEVRVQRLERALSALPSPGVGSETVKIFGWWPHIEGFDRSSDDFRTEWRRLQLEAIEAILGSGLTELEELVDQAENAYGVGTALAETFPSDAHDSLMLGWLESSEGNRVEASRGYLSWRANSDRGREWLEATLRATEFDHRRSALVLLAEPSIAADLLESFEPELAESYWQNVSPWRVEPAQARAAFERLLAVDRPLDALHLLEISHMREERGGPAGFDVVDAEAGLRSMLRRNSKEKSSGDGQHVVASAFDFLQKRGADIDLVAPLEFAFFSVLVHSSHTPVSLYRVLRERPAEFVNLVKMSTKSTRDDEPPPDAGVASNAWRILSEWNELPGTDGSNWEAQPEQLRTWVTTAREMLAESGRSKIGDEKVGAVLASGAGSAGEGWPCLAVRELLEELGSKDIEQGFYSSARNARGIYTKAVYEGGTQEREIAQRFRDRSVECSDWRRTSRLLRAIADSYDREARSQDASARWDEDDL